MKTPWFQLFLAVFVLLPSAGASQETGLVDRIVAVVDEDPILESDIERVVGLGLLKADHNELEGAFRRRVVDTLIAERLRFHEIDRFGFSEISRARVEDALAEIKSRTGGEGVFRARLEELGSTEEDVRQLIARQLMVLTYVDERLGPRVFVDRQSIELYYEEVLVPELRSRGKPVPTVASVREEIRGVLREQRLDEELERWTEELRAEADIEDYFDAELTELPSVVIGSEGDGGD